MNDQISGILIAGVILAAASAKSKLENGASTGTTLMAISGTLLLIRSVLGNTRNEGEGRREMELNIDLQ